ncbi:gluconokinase [Glomus cerebriforme]|uniref:Gluconokinase n=1 Tax=Glomus cerebriforme TaxID=658196 RepID=A0A397TBZ3_9GLOM|nr:gluconokinase [Glomus cerebriforme]
MVLVFILMGTSASGKSHIGNLIAQELDVPFIEGDDLHSSSGIQKMKSGIPLNDEDRKPWLNAVKNEIINVSKSSSKPYIFVACSALKYNYREFLRKVPNNDNIKVWFIYLKGSKQLFQQRILERQNHFMKAKMLDSQFDSLEEPNQDSEERIIVVDVSKEADKVKEEIIEKINTISYDVI